MVLPCYRAEFGQPRAKSGLPLARTREKPIALGDSVP